MKLDKAASMVASLGVPGIVLAVALAVSGFTGAAALTTALAALGGPFGMLGGIVVLGIISVAAGAISKHGSEKFVRVVIEKLIQNGETRESIKSKIVTYPISNDLKRSIREHLDGVEAA